MKKLTTYLNEKLIVNKHYKQHIYSPKSWKELRRIVEKRFEELGPGTEQEPIDFNDIDISELETFVSDKRGVFEETNFEYIDISDWDVSNVKNMGGMFYGCKKLISVGNLSKWNVAHVKDMDGMFYGCNKLVSIGDLSNWKVSKVEDMTWMFRWCERLNSVGDLSNWKVSNVLNMNEMFYGSGITNIPDWYKG